MDLRAVTFDFWNTLMWEPAGVLAAARLREWGRSLDAAGHRFPAARLAAAHGVAVTNYDAAWKANIQYRVEDATGDMLDALELEVDPCLRAALLAGFSVAGAAADLRLADGVEQCLNDLAGRGLALGVVCDIGLTPSPVLRDRLADHGLLDRFTALSFSDEIGAYKPASAIFEHAMATLGVAAGETAHVGDRRRTDVAGALAAGMTAVRYAGVFDDDLDATPEAPIVIDDHQSLVAALGL